MLGIEDFSPALRWAEMINTTKTLVRQRSKMQSGNLAEAGASRQCYKNHLDNMMMMICTQNHNRRSTESESEKLKIGIQQSTITKSESCSPGYKRKVLKLLARRTSRLTFTKCRVTWITAMTQSGSRIGWQVQIGWADLAWYE